jgi:hypothetical protein
MSTLPDPESHDMSWIPLAIVGDMDRACLLLTHFVINNKSKYHDWLSSPRKR